MITPDSYMEANKELSTLLRYPPFSSISERNEETGKWLGEIAGEEMTDFHNEVIAPAVKEQGGSTYEIEGEPFEEFIEKWQEELEEAELYQARYGDDFLAAEAAANGDE